MALPRLLVERLTAALLASATSGCAATARKELGEHPATVESIIRSASVSAPATPHRYAKTSTDGIAALDTQVWPPPPIMLASPAEELEGVWVAWDRPWLHKVTGAPPTFFTTFLRPDPKRSAKVKIVALDARQLELDMAVGVEGPYPPNEKKLGKWPRTKGMLPRDSAVATHVVAAFNGGFRFDGGAWGMMIRKREFVPPVKDVASVVMFDDGRLGFGVWGPTMKVGPDIRSLRQNLDPLFDDGVVNPRNRLRWGGIKPVDHQVGQRAKRSGICRSSGGHLFYFGGSDLEPFELGNAMKAAGCDFGMHLDMNPFHVGFVFMSFEDELYKNGSSESLAGIGVNSKHYVHEASPKEFFYATLREPVLPKLFHPDGLPQPAPAWQPGILSKTDGEVEIVLFDSTRVRLRLVVGDDELDSTGLATSTRSVGLPADDTGLVLASLGFGSASKGDKLGLTQDGVIYIAASDSMGTVSIDNQNRWNFATSGALPSGGSHVQSRVLIAEGKILEVPPTLAVVFGVNEKGDLLVARSLGRVAPRALLEAIIRAGCIRALGPRGGTGAFARAGKDEILAGGRDTQLLVIARPPTPATFRFDKDESGALRWPKVAKPLK